MKAEEESFGKSVQFLKERKKKFLHVIAEKFPTKSNNKYQI